MNPTNCSACDTFFENPEWYSKKCQTCSLCVICCNAENHGICSPEEINEYETWKETNESSPQ